MRYVLVFLFMMFEPAWAGGEILCGSGHNSAKVWSKEGRVWFRFDDNLGFQNFPIYYGVVTLPMLPLIQRASKELAPFDGAMILSWEESKCQWSETNRLLVQCNGAGKLEFPEGTTFTNTGLSTSVESQERLDLKFGRVHFQLGIDTPKTNYTHHFIDFAFDKERCTGRATSQ